jgi:hypothetical protein
VTTGAKFDLVGHFYTPTFSSLEFISFRCQIHQRRRAQYFGTVREMIILYMNGQPVENIRYYGRR